MQRDDITVVAGLLEGIKQGLLSLESHGNNEGSPGFEDTRGIPAAITSYEEKKGHLSMKLSDFLEYLKQRKQVNPSRDGKTETAFSRRTANSRRC
jgi:uncharacterized short protein YbdD (DUF466 family)